MDARALHASLKKNARDGPSQLHGVSSCVVKWSRSVEINEGDVLALVWLLIFFIQWLSVLLMFSLT